MSRRRGRAHHHERARSEGPRPATPAAQGSAAAPAPPAKPAPVVTETVAGPSGPLPNGPLPNGSFMPQNGSPPPQHPVPTAQNGAAAPQNGAAAPQNGTHALQNGRPASQDGAPPAPRTNGHAPTSSCTQPQLRRFIKSRAYVPMHELRRRFAIDGGDDDVFGVELDQGRIFVGLPAREGAMLGELVRGGEVGYELSLDPRTPVVVGVYPMRPVPRP